MLLPQYSLFLKCIVQWFPAYSLACAYITTNSVILSSPQKGIPDLGIQLSGRVFA
jgi:hypothetical protein